MKNRLISITLIIAAFLFVLFISKSSKQTTNKITSPVREERVWQIKSIDTMKYSRDLSGAKLSDPTFDQTIDKQVKAIKGAGASHVAIGTPYDEKFIPILSRWVNSARKNGLSVWFRGNFSGWEGWFGFDGNLTRQEHTELLRKFISQNASLFKDGDIFSPCPECENGGPGDPRQNGDVAGHRQFLIDERNVALEEFKKIKKNVIVTDSMNYDVAKLIMDKETAGAMGNLVGIDHYVKSPQRLAGDIENLQQNTNAQIFLGEFGAPIPDIHGSLTQEAQASWIEEALGLVSKNKNVIGLNYWVAVGGSTAIFNDDLTPKPAAEVVKKYFSLTKLD